MIIRFLVAFHRDSLNFEAGSVVAWRNVSDAVELIGAGIAVCEF